MVPTVLPRLIIAVVTAVGSLTVGTAAAAGSMAGHASASEADLQASVGRPGSRYFYLFLGDLANVYVESTAPELGIHPPLVIDTSGLSDRVALGPLPSECQSEGSRTVCQANSNNYAFMLPVRAVAGAAPGRAGFIAIRVEPSAGSDPDSSNNSAKLDIDVVAPGSTTPVVAASTPTGRVGDVVTVPISVHNPGPNTLRSVTILDVSARPGVEYVATPGCAGSSPTVVCRQEMIYAGTTYTVSIRFKIVGCGPNAAGTGGSYTLDWAEPFNSRRVLPRPLAINVVGCGQAGPANGTTTASVETTPSSAVSSAAPALPISPLPSRFNATTAPAATAVAGGTSGSRRFAAIAIGGAAMASVVAGLLLWRRRRATRLASATDTPGGST